MSAAFTPHPAIPLLLAALAMPLLGANGRRVAALLGPALALVFLAVLPEGASWTLPLLGETLEPLRVGKLGRVFALAFAGYGLIASVYAWTETDAARKGFQMALCAGGVGVALAGDWISLFLFWELLTVCSLFIIWQGRDRAAGGAGNAALGAGLRYLLLHLGGGVCLLAGLLLQWRATGSLAVEAVALSGAGPWLLAIGLLTNAAAPPLHAWLPDAYPRATVFGSVFLSAFTTKAAVCVLARVLPGAEPLTWIGAGMTLYGVTFAVMENDMRRLLAYHIMSQVGYMVCAVGIGSTLALNGSAAHAFAHIFYKGLLMMSAGAVVHAVGTGRLSELGGLARALRPVLVLMLIGAFSISGVPPLNGFVSKALAVSAAGYEHRPVVELILLAASVGTFLSVGLKMPWLAFGPRADGKAAAARRPVPRSMLLAMGLAAAACVATGVFPGLLYSLLPYPMKYAPYTADHVVSSLQLLLATALVFLLLRGLLVAKSMRTLDVDTLYREPLARLVRGAGVLLERAQEAAGDVLEAILAAGGALRARVRGRALPTWAQALLLSMALVATAIAALWR